MDNVRIDSGDFCVGSGRYWSVQVVSGGFEWVQMVLGGFYQL